MNAPNRRLFLKAAAGAAGLLARSPAWGAETEPVVETTGGKVRGKKQGSAFAFKNIPYGDPAGGSRRFMAPAKAQPWSGVRDGFELGPQAPQNPSAPLLPVFLDGLTEQNPVNSEDCLQVHVWTPAIGRGERRAVMVWLHGGGFGSGSPNWPIYDGRNLAAKQGVVVVGVKHRVNAFGYLYLAEIGGEKYADSGTAGMQDIVLALEWVRDNIANFGGDPGNVTIFGESGGGAKVSTLMAMPSAKGVFHKAIAQSTVSLKAMTRAEATKAAEGLLAKLGLKPSQLDDLQKLPMRRLLDAMQTPGQYGFSPVLDGRALPNNPFDPMALQLSAGVPLLIGVNATEITGLIRDISTKPIDAAKLKADVKKDLKASDAAAERVIAAYRKALPKATDIDIYLAIASDDAMGADVYTAQERRLTSAKAPTYVYELTWTLPFEGGRYRSPHLMDVPLVFENVDAARNMYGPSPAAQTLAGRMSGAWAAFARTGNPDSKGIPHWPAYTAAQRAAMIFDTECRAAVDPLRGRREAILAFRSERG
jgi:para-nitrobenzyl esterase